MNEIINYYDNLAKSYDEDRFNNAYGKFIDKQERILLDKILTDKNEMILDLACGSGRLLDYANFGVDASANMIEIARSKFKNKNLFVNDAEKTVLESNSIDTIICFHFFMHLDQNKINSILLECNRVLKKSGRIIFDIPSKKRRKIFNFKSNNWHGGFSTSIAELNLNPHFTIKRTFGLIFFPIHRFPKFVRKFLIKIDLQIANSFLKEYSSYIIIEFRKNERS
jgi:ubiquinone/menaquinone biosynthesis C-methylase UbiE